MGPGPLPRPFCRYQERARSMLGLRRRSLREGGQRRGPSVHSCGPGGGGGRQGRSGKQHGRIWRGSVLAGADRAGRTPATAASAVRRTAGRRQNNARLQWFRWWSGRGLAGGTGSTTLPLCRACARGGERQTQPPSALFCECLRILSTSCGTACAAVPGDWDSQNTNTATLAADGRSHDHCIAALQHGICCCTQAVLGDRPPGHFLVRLSTGAMPLWTAA